MALAAHVDRAWYRRLVAEAGGEPEDAFVRLGTPAVLRTARQLSGPQASPGMAELLLRDVWQTAVAAGLPRTEPDQRPKRPAPLDEDFLAGAADSFRDRFPYPAQRPPFHRFYHALLQLLLQEEFLACTQTYQETDPKGHCDRQEPKVFRGRLSGVHCADCPFFLSLGREAHEKALAAKWRNPAEALGPHLAAALPEDYRLLRTFVFLHRCAP